MLSSSKETGPPDEWLSLSDAERALIERRAHELDLDPMPPVLSEAPTELTKPEPMPDVTPTQSSLAPNLSDAVDMAESLEPDDRMRLIARLWESLPPRNRAAIIAFGLENIHCSDDDKPQAPDEQLLEPIWPKVWELLFNPAKTSELYSAPRRFDLATIFVITAVYSLLFGAATAMDYGPVTVASLGVFVTLVAASQAWFQHTANPRGISIISGSVSLSIILATIGTIEPHWFDFPLPAAVLYYGLIGGAISGYLAGAVVGGVFLVIDLVRGKFEKRAKKESVDTTAGNSE